MIVEDDNQHRGYNGRSMLVILQKLPAGRKLKQSNSVGHEEMHSPFQRVMEKCNDTKARLLVMHRAGTRYFFATAFVQAHASCFAVAFSAP